MHAVVQGIKRLLGRNLTGSSTFRTLCLQQMLPLLLRPGLLSLVRGRTPSNC